MKAACLSGVQPSVRAATRTGVKSGESVIGKLEP
jgi:hypothetical protein